MAEIVGAAFGTGLFGALIAWVLRKLTGMALILSYAVGVFVMIFVAPAVYVLNSDGRVSYADAWIMYAIGGVIGFLMLCVTARANRST